MGRKWYKKNWIQTSGSELIDVKQERLPLLIKDGFRMPNLETRNWHTASPKISSPENVITDLWNDEIQTAPCRNTAARKQRKVISLNRLVPYPRPIERRIQVPDKGCNFQRQNVRPNVNKPQNIPEVLLWPLVVTTKIAWSVIRETKPTKQLWIWGLACNFLILKAVKLE